MKLWFNALIASIFTYLTFIIGAEAQGFPTLPDNIDQYSVWVGLLIVVFEYLLANTKIVKANSTIDLIVNFVKSLFGFNRYNKY